MDWTAPYLVAALAVLAAVEIWFVAAIIFVGHRYRAALRAGPRSGPALARSALDHEELGLLAGGEQRWSEVALLRLCLEGHLREDGLIILADDPGETPAADQPRSARDAILGRMRGRRPAHLLDVVHAGHRHGDSSGAYRRLAELGLVDAGAVAVARTRQRVVVVYVALLTVTLIATIVCLAIAAGSSATPAVLGAMGLFVVCMTVTGLASRFSGARFEVITPGGQELLDRERRDEPGPADDRLLHRVALRGLSIVPEFARAADRGNPDAGLNTRQQGFNAATGLFSALIGLFPGSGSGGSSTGGSNGASGPNR